MAPSEGKELKSADTRELKLVRVRLKAGCESYLPDEAGGRAVELHGERYRFVPATLGGAIGLMVTARKDSSVSHPVFVPWDAIASVWPG